MSGVRGQGLAGFELGCQARLRMRYSGMQLAW